jgi:dipeptidyl-peptidase-4
MKEKKYESVLDYAGRKRKAYAANNVEEYFAEATEAFFGTNDFFPFVRAELREHDPELYRVLERIWAD